MAAKSPNAVAIRASAMPGPTARNVAVSALDKPMKDVSTPHTVPNNPMNGATDAVVARNVRRVSSNVTSAVADRCIMR